MFFQRSSAVILLTTISVVLLPKGEVHADFGAGTITFEESTYQLYHNDSGNFVNYTTANGASTVAGTGYSAIDYTTGVFTVSDDAAIPYNAWFKADTDVYVRFAFDKNNGGTIDSSDIPAVIEATYAAGSSLNKKPDGTLGATILGGPFAGASADNDVFAYTSGANPSEKTDFVASGFEDQAGNYFVRARKNADGGQESNAAADQESWTSFIIEYATTNGATVDSATGEIWDIDGSSSAQERFAVTATTTTTSATENSPTGTSTDSSSLDAKPWQWSFSGLSGSITQIKFTRFSGGSYKDYFPLAFNNFNPVSAIGYLTPEPSSLLAFGGIFSIAVLRRRRRSDAKQVS